MSELTQCNYCSYQRILADARRCGMTVTVLPRDFGLGGVAVYMHPRRVKIRNLEIKDRDKFEKSWFMALGTRCEC
jgi:hypothetical protein